VFQNRKGFGPGQSTPPDQQPSLKIRVPGNPLKKAGGAGVDLTAVSAPASKIRLARSR